jgi:hypothetical protein
MPANYSVKTTRGQTSVKANHQRIGSASDRRWATGRNVKVALPDHMFGIAEVWTLKERGSDGKVRVVDQNVTREDAEAFVRGQ